MNLLLDTHTVIWFLNGDSRIPKHVIQLIENPENKSFVSTASIWEIAIKLSLGKLSIEGDLNDIKYQFFLNDLILLPISFEHVITLFDLEFHHTDPFDRLIISQALTDNLIIVSKDQHFHKYHVDLMW